MAIKDQCPFCRRPLDDIRRVGHALHQDQRSSFFLGAKCAMCGIDYQRMVGAHECDWWCSRATPDSLICRIEPDEVDQITQKLSRYKTTGSKWQEFLGKKLHADELWRFKNNSTEGNTGLTIVRECIPIADFTIFGNI